MKISATIITLNEERNIGRCIESLVGVADEIIVLDSFSEDRTKEICEKAGVRFEQRKWEGYSASKNYLNSLAQYEYILSLDADEALDADLREALLACKNDDEPGIYSVNRITNYCGKWIKHGGWYPDVKIRLFPKAGSQWVGAHVHEELEYPAGLKERQLPGHLEHYSYYSFKEHRERADKYSALTAAKFYEQGKRVGAMKPYVSAIGRFIGMYFVKKGILDGRMGFKIAWISAQSNVFKYKELLRLQRENAA
ncbi:MAG: glycosyltransferase family 2 protein [Fluviicola sp. XM-24bin1]|nr:MAG: glycosyltransferase family 2 protein [Fluviicola sp. XM-24bin1]